ncbi:MULTISPECIES: SDR family oxidoreductase [unclassified Novosphingobium]|uniref:SDR family NAD(P)-dependent oxidoreductase n=1 Tax=unclassified Novosphingobium TaxID=2644732 RepID=UPI000D303DDF|nr:MULTISPECIES: SDR family oxidoreductase [unclassified Novosphingobium]PTR12556.1 3-oxoacyl-[acyl-carrier protein] reductase [Novosphingobium sp. GV055]PUB06340.1 3-oxoacyl-[acyl-carrier protein] reductase [Novosphingobium sp. GV061]PUB22391.1 3-oxoacyl-[acyl-carrier protein] reductase [Novosphingobium sp. GV079]PUB44416.1 3-oxoacyl-[acyl-carrier protein] reductase [Novosphingobium sp. GV027]
MDIGIAGRRAIICGGSRGMSKAAARRLSLEGAEVTIVARTSASLESAAAELAAESGHPVHWFATDLTTPEGRQALIKAHPDPDILVANAGVPQSSIPYQQLTREDWMWWFDAHFFSAFELIQNYAPGMCERGFGRIVNVSANFIKFPQVGVAHSHAARLALAGAIASLVREVAPFNVTINSVLPGLINTEALQASLTDRAKARGVPYEAVEAEVRARCAAARLADPQEAGDLIAMLCAAQMGYLTGQNIINDGGAYQGLF